MAENRVIGTWRLVSLENRGADGKVRYPYGKDALGYIIYSEDGYMSAILMAKSRPLFKSADLGGTVEEKVAASDTFLSYCGKYELRSDKVIHNVELSFYPNWMGKEQVRFYRFEGERLILSTPPFLFEGIEQTSHLVWQRA